MVGKGLRLKIQSYDMSLGRPGDEANPLVHSVLNLKHSLNCLL